MKAKKISFLIIDFSHNGGVEKVTADTIKLFQNNDIPVYQLISLYQENPKPAVDYPENLDIQVIYPPKKSHIEHSLTHFFQNNPTDILIFQGDNVSISKSILNVAKKYDIRAIPQYHGSPYAYLSKFPDALSSNIEKRIWASIMYPFKKKSLENYLKKVSESFVCVSDGIREELNQIFNDKKLKEKTITIRNPMFISISEDYHLDCKEKNISFISRLETRHKNAFLAIKAWKLIHHKFPEWNLNIFGKGKLENQIKDFCTQNNIKNLHLKGFSKDIAKELSKSSIAISTSNCEGFSMAIAEALAYGNAVAITDSKGGISDMVTHKQTGLVSPMNNEFLLAKNIEKLIEDIQLREKLALAGQQRIKEIINNSIIEQWKDILNKKSS